MPAPFPQSKDGNLIANSPTGFPAFYDKRKPRILVADIWAYMSSLVIEKLSKEQKRRALAYLEQAFDFFEAATTPRLGSKPLLYYYSFLNLAKVALLINNIDFPPSVYHGITDPRRNHRERLQFKGQKIEIKAIGGSNFNLFPYFTQLFRPNDNFTISSEKKVIDLGIRPDNRTMIYWSDYGESIIHSL
jgi:YaaC-like Protein